MSRRRSSYLSNRRGSLRCSALAQGTPALVACIEEQETHNDVQRLASIMDMAQTKYKDDGNKCKNGVCPEISIWEKVRFSMAITAYRIFRLSLEIFLVEHVLASGHSTSVAGLIFLVYSLADVCSGLFFLWFPTICFGSRIRATLYFCVAVGCVGAGFVGLFLSTALPFMLLFATIMGCGTATWFVNYQTLTNTFFANLDQIAKIRQGFECIGFLLPSICLAIVSQVSHMASMHDGEPYDNESQDMSITRITALALGAIGVVFFLCSADVVIRSATQIKTKSQALAVSDKDVEAAEGSLDKSEADQPEGVWDSVRTFFRSSILNYFFVDSVLLAAVNLLFGTMSLTTQEYFGLDPTFLWLAAIGFPIGGMISVALSLSMGSTRDSKTRVWHGGLKMILVFTIMIAVSPAIQSGPTTVDGVAKTGLFFFGVVVGGLYSSTFSSAFALWLSKLVGFKPDFVSRANVFHNVGVQAFIACIFQVQTILIDAVQDNPNTTVTVYSSVFFGPLIFLILVAITASRTLAYPKNASGWPPGPPFTAFQKFLTTIIHYTGAPEMADAILFAVYCAWRTGFVSANLTSTTIQGGPCIDKEAKLTAEGLTDHVQKLSQLEKEEESWTGAGTLRNILLSSEAANQKWDELLRKAKHEICIVTWALDGEIGFHLAKELIKHHTEGIRVRVMVDASNLFFLEEKHKMFCEVSTCGLILQQLLTAGIEVRMLSTLFQDTKQPYFIGSHRKILLVDGKWLLTGGRNCDDHYRTKEESGSFVFHDADVVLEGSFEDSVGLLLDTLWLEGKPTLFDSMAEENEVSESETDTGSDLGSVAIGTISGEDKATSEMESGQEFFDLVGAKSLSSIDQEVDIVQLSHPGGSATGLDIVLSALVFQFEKAETSIDLIFGYFHLFDPIKVALQRAIARGVKVRVFTNSKSTNDLPFQNQIFRRSFEGLMELGAEIFVPSEESKDLCLHYKMCLIDSHVLTIGSWNCIGIFFESEFSVVLFDKSNQDNASPAAFTSVEWFMEESIDTGRLVRMESLPEEWTPPPVTKLVTTKHAQKYMERGID